jgi:hypothetical protein
MLHCGEIVLYGIHHDANWAYAGGPVLVLWLECLMALSCRARLIRIRFSRASFATFICHPAGALANTSESVFFVSYKMGLFFKFLAYIQGEPKKVILKQRAIISPV